MRKQIKLTESELHDLIETTVRKIINEESENYIRTINTENGLTLNLFKPEEINNVPRFLRPMAQSNIDNFGYIVKDEHDMPVDNEFDFEEIKNEIDKI